MKAAAQISRNLANMIQFGQKFGTIYADPPWSYDNVATRSSAEDLYETMSVEDICSLPVRELVADRAHLHLWTTNAFLFESKSVMEAWGFEYKSAFIWIKNGIGMGNYWRVTHEFLLLGVRGSCTFADKSLVSWLYNDRGEHSAKPEKVRMMIEKASPGPYLELFGRRAVEGWTVWGDQVQEDLFFQHKEIS